MEHEALATPSTADVPRAPGVEAEVEAILDGVADLPLGEQVAVFESVHRTLVDRLDEREA